MFGRAVDPQEPVRRAMEITSVMQLLNHDFSFHEFEAELVNLLQRVLFEKDISDIAQYEPEARRAVWEISYTVNIQE